MTALLEVEGLRAGYGGSAVATAVNGAFVPVAARHGQRLGHGDRVEVLAPRQGG